MANKLKKFSWNDIEIEDDSKGVSESSFRITKTDTDKRLVFGWALVSATADGQKIIDHQGDIVEQDELEQGAYEYVLNFRDAGEEHNASLRKKARMVESVVFTEEKLKAMNIPAGTVPYGWWIGFYVDDDKTWELIKNGTYKMFSIEGRAIREPVNEPLAKSFSDVLKYNDNHDPDTGRFAPKGGGGGSAGSGSGGGKINELTENGITMTYVRIKNQKTQNFGATYGQNIEPAGEYMSMDTMQGAYKVPLPNYEYGTITFKKPLVVDHKSTGENGWKKDLMEKYGGKTGKRLSNAIKRDGYDAIMTRDESGDFIEIVNLSGEKINKSASFSELIEKFNPYHDRLGRFASAGSYASFTVRTKDPSKQHMADMAVAREKERSGGATATNQRLKPVRPREDTPRVKAINKIEMRIKNQNFESAAIVDDDGNELFFKDGQASEVRFTRAECNQMPNTTMIHNHPRCSMFSYEDLTCMVNNQIYETRVVNRDGTVYSMKRAAGGYSTGRATEFAEAYKKQYLRGTMHAQRDLDARGFQDKLWKGEVSQAEANIEFGRSCAKYMADWTSKTAPDYGLEFTVENGAVSTQKSMGDAVMAKADGEKDDYLILDRDTNDLEDRAFKEWLDKAMKSGNAAKSFSDVLTERSE